jgi:hypothetical protein
MGSSEHSKGSEFLPQRGDKNREEVLQFSYEYNGSFYKSSAIWNMSLHFIVCAEKLQVEERVKRLPKSLKEERLSET